MNKFLLRFLLTTLLFIICELAEAINHNRNEYNLNGNIYCIGLKDYFFDIEFGELNRGSLINETYTYFLQNGNVYIDSLIDKKMYRRYNYDEHNNIIEEMRILVGTGRKGKIGNTEFQYNDTTDCYRYNNMYDTDGKIKEINKFSKHGQIQRIIYSNTMTSNNAVYWGKNNIEKEIITTNTSKTTKLYSSINDYKSPYTIIVETLNKKGLTVKKSIEVVGGLGTSETIYTYDEHNNIINETSKVRNAWGQGENVLITNRYDYDKNGNWIRKIVFKNGIVKSWTERVIFYASSLSDYSKIVEQDKQVSEKHKRIVKKERLYLDSIHNKEIEEAARKKQFEDSLAAREQLYKEMDVIIERELLQKHITASYDYNTATYNMKISGFNNKIRDCIVNGTTIDFFEKKGMSCYIANMPEYRVCRYRWDWDASHETYQIIGVLYSQDLSELLLCIPGAKKKGAIYYPMIVALHKQSNTYISYEIEKDAFDKLEKEVSPYNKSQTNNISTQYLRWNGKIDKKL